MKFFAVVAAALVAAVQAKECSLNALIGLLGLPDAATCSDETGFALTGSAPTADQLPKICDSAACQSLFKTLTDTITRPCVAPVVNVEIYSTFVDPINSFCESRNPPAPTTEAPGPGPVPGPGPTVTPAPGPSTPAPEPSAC